MNEKYTTMSFEEYAKSSHKAPYVFDVTNGNKKLVYFGAAHSNRPDDKMFDQIREKFEKFEPELVFVEGCGSLVKDKKAASEWVRDFGDDDTIIRKEGENIFMIKLAVEAGVDFDSPEPDYEREINHLLEKGFGKEEIFAYYMYRHIEQWHRIPEAPPIAKYLGHTKDEFEEVTDWQDFDYSLEHLNEIGKRIWGESGKFSNYNNSRTDPTPWQPARGVWTEVNRIAQESSYFRDRYIVARIEEALNKVDKLFVVFGASHAYMQEPVIRKMFSSLK
ncbi:MAG TPA: hypothetical protein VJH71_00210 [Candidatus Paceibacterota bacterium]